MQKAFILSFLLILTLSSAVIAETWASVPKPSVPEFSIQFIDLSYDIPASSSIDPYTGQTVTNPARHVDNRTLEFTFKNQLFMPYYDSSSNFNIALYYNIRMKGHFTENWTSLYSIGNYPRQSNSEYTVISVPLGSQSDTPLQWLPSNSSSQVDFQVEAMIGYFSRSVDISFAPWYFIGEESGWSSTQTVTIYDNSTTTLDTSPAPSSAVPSPTTTPLQSSIGSDVLFGLGWWQEAVVVLSVVVVVLVLALVFLCRRSVGLKPVSLP
jgi:hypothetical protein